MYWSLLVNTQQKADYIKDQRPSLLETGIPTCSIIHNAKFANRLTFIIDREAREIMHLVASVRLSVCLSVWVYPGHIIHHYAGIWATCAPGRRTTCFTSLLPCWKVKVGVKVKGQAQGHGSRSSSWRAAVDIRGSALPSAAKSNRSHYQF